MCYTGALDLIAARIPATTVPAIPKFKICWQPTLYYRARFLHRCLCASGLPSGTTPLQQDSLTFQQRTGSCLPCRHRCRQFPTWEPYPRRKPTGGAVSRRRIQSVAANYSCFETLSATSTFLCVRMHAPQYACRVHNKPAVNTACLPGTQYACREHGMPAGNTVRMLGTQYACREHSVHAGNTVCLPGTQQAENTRPPSRTALSYDGEKLRAHRTRVACPSRFVVWSAAVRRPSRWPSFLLRLKSGQVERGEGKFCQTDRDANNEQDAGRNTARQSKSIPPPTSSPTTAAMLDTTSSRFGVWKEQG